MSVRVRTSVVAAVFLGVSSCPRVDLRDTPEGTRRADVLESRLKSERRYDSLRSGRDGRSRLSESKRGLGRSRVVLTKVILTTLRRLFLRVVEVQVRPLRPAL